METNTNTSFKGSFKAWLHARGKDPRQTESSKTRLLRLIKQGGEHELTAQGWDAFLKKG